MPKWNSGTQVIGLAMPMIYEYTSFDYNVSLGGYLVPCTSADHGGLTCVIQVNTPNSVAEISTQLDILKIDGLTTAIAAGDTFTM